MMRLRFYRVPIALLPLLAGCAGGGAVPVAPAPVSAADAEFETLYRARLEAARGRFTPADVAFVTGMIGHHAQALVMADLVPDRSADPSIGVLAARLTNAQIDEIASMERWLADRGQPVPEAENEHSSHMPGMLTAEQLQELEAAEGADFDRLFLQYMIQHHEGAVVMVEDLFRTDGAGQDEAVFRLASDIQVDQRTEIARMRLMLEERSARGDRTGDNR